MTDNSNGSSMISFYNDINAHLYGGGNVSHILNIIINEPITNENATLQRATLSNVFHTINNVPFTFNIKNLNVVITWRSNDNLNYYHADVMGIYGDVAVKLHTEMLLKQFNDDECFGKTIIAFMVTKPLVRTIPI
jgi:hypothetical protein